MLEQAAGRKALGEARLNDVTLRGKIELQRRFGKDAILAASWERRDTTVWVDIMVKPADAPKGDGTVMIFTEPLENFPSEECIANLALVT